MVTYMLRRSQNPHGVPFCALGVMKPLSDAQWSFIERLCVHRSSIYFYGTHCYNAVVRSLSGGGLVIHAFVYSSYSWSFFWNETRVLTSSSAAPSAFSLSLATDSLQNGRELPAFTEGGVTCHVTSRRSFLIARQISDTWDLLYSLRNASKMLYNVSDDY